MKYSTAILPLAGALATFAPSMGAQQMRTLDAVGQRMCGPAESVVSIRVHDSAGQPVRNASVDLTRVRDGKSLGAAKEMSAGTGEFALFESSALRWVTASGDSIAVGVHAGSRNANAVVVIARDSTGCRITRRAGSGVIVVK